MSSRDWSGDGFRLVFQRRIEGTTEIWVLEADGSGPTRIIGEAEGQGQSPRLSPNGDWLLFTRSVEHADGHFAPQLFVWDLTDGGGVRQIADDLDGVSDAVWSPDGEWIAFRDGRSFVATVRPDGRDQTASETKGLPLDWGPVIAACGDDVA